MDGLIEAENVEAWKEKLIFDYNNRKNISVCTQYISEQSIREYIMKCAKECVEYLKPDRGF